MRTPSRQISFMNVVDVLAIALASSQLFFGGAKTLLGLGLLYLSYRLVAKSGLFNLFTGSDHIPMIDELTRSVSSLASKGMGALIAIEGRDPLTGYVTTGALVDALLSRRLLEAIFSPASPIKGGGVVVSRGRIVAADCLLPMSRNHGEGLNERRRAALGLTEETDALALVVSEDGDIALAMGGKLETSLDLLKLRGQLLVVFGKGGGA